MVRSKEEKRLEGRTGGGRCGGGAALSDGLKRPPLVCLLASEAAKELNRERKAIKAKGRSPPHDGLTDHYAADCCFRSMPSATLSSAYSPPSVPGGPLGRPVLRPTTATTATTPSSSFSSSSRHCARRRLLLPRVVDGSKETETSVDFVNERSESDKLVDSMDFGELCNEFECISSPQVESTARQLARDILELREGNKILGSYTVSVKYKDPVRSFVGREKYSRPLWATDALENPSVAVQEMTMLSTSVLSIKWTLKGKPKNLVFASLGGDLIIRVNSLFTLNQISGQVIEHEESWDLSQSSPVAQGYFWISRRSFSAVESVKDAADAVKNATSRSSTQKENWEIFPDPSGDPTKFFQRDDDLQRDVYQFALVLAVIYFVVQYLRTTL